MTLSNRISRMRGADLIREGLVACRPNAGRALLSGPGRERSVIARWEQGAVMPGFKNLLDAIEACGFELPLDARASPH